MSCPAWWALLAWCRASSGCVVSHPLVKNVSESELCMLTHVGTKFKERGFFFFFYTCWLIGICMRIQNIDGFGNPFVVWIPSELWNLECASSNRKPYSCHFSAWRSLQEHNLILLVCWWLWDLAAEAGIEPKLIATFFLKRFKTWPTLSFLQCETAQLWIK